MTTPLKLTEDEKRIAKECGLIYSGKRISGTEHEIAKFVAAIERAAILRERERVMVESVDKLCGHG